MSGSCHRQLTTPLTQQGQRETQCRERCAHYPLEHEDITEELSLFAAPIFSWNLLPKHLSGLSVRYLVTCSFVKQLNIDTEPPDCKGSGLALEG